MNRDEPHIDMSLVLATIEQASKDLRQGPPEVLAIHIQNQELRRRREARLAGDPLIQSDQ